MISFTVVGIMVDDSGALQQGSSCSANCCSDSHCCSLIERISKNLLDICTENLGPENKLKRRQLLVNFINGTAETLSSVEQSHLSRLGIVCLDCPELLENECEGLTKVIRSINDDINSEQCDVGKKRKVSFNEPVINMKVCDNEPKRKKKKVFLFPHGRSSRYTVRRLRVLRASQPTMAEFDALVDDPKLSTEERLAMADYLNNKWTAAEIEIAKLLGYESRWK